MQFLHFRSRVISRFLLAALLLCPGLTPLQAQVGVASGVSTLAPTAVKTVSVAPGATVLTNITVDAGPEGNDTIDTVVSSPNVTLSLILPNGAEVTAANAASLGFTFTSFTVPGEPDDDLPNPLASAGTHLTMEFPDIVTSGVYQVKAVATGLTSEAILTVTYYSSSAVALAATVDAEAFRAGDTVVLSALLFNGTTPITGATVTAAASPILPVTGSIGTYQLISQQTVEPGVVEFTYSARLTNSGPAVVGAHAMASIVSGDIELVSPGLAFGDVAAGVTVASANNFVARSRTGSFDPASLTWTISSLGAPVPVTLVDGGQFDAAPGDGIYTGTFAVPLVGVYSAAVSATGTAGGLAFERTAFIDIRVNPDRARIVSAPDEPFYDVGTAEPVAVDVKANVNVQYAGSYTASVELVAPNGRTTRASATASLPAGLGQMTLRFESDQILSLQSDGPYTKKNLRLQFNQSDETGTVDYSENAGATQPYALASFPPPPVVLFPGPNAAAGIDANGVAGFETLRVVANLSILGGLCQWGAQLLAPDQSLLDIVRSQGPLPAGNSQIWFDFSGRRIAASGKNGPYEVQNAWAACVTANQRSQNARAVKLFTTQPFAAADFEGATANFSLLMLQSNAAVTPGSFSSRLQGQITPQGGFSSPVTLSLTGLPAGVTQVLGTATVPNVPFVLQFSAAAAAQPGTYPLTLTATAGALSRTASLTLTVTAAPITVSVTPKIRTVSEGQSAQFSATVMNAPDSTVTWSVSPLVGNISAGGLYTAPATLSRSQDLVVRASSIRDPSISDTARLTLSPAALAVALSPETVNVFAGQARQFQAHVLNGAGVTWSLSPPVGSISPAGLYTAPASLAQQQFVTVLATTVDTPARTAGATVRLVPVGIFLTPAHVTVPPGGSVSFSATVTGATNPALTWSVSPPVGAVDAAGRYTAPATVPGPQTVTVTATSVADPGRVAAATVLVRQPQAVSITPPSADIYGTQSRLFSAVVSNSPNQQVTWSLNPNSGAMQSNGLYVASTSIAGIAGLTVSAASVADPAKTGDVTVTLRPPASISASPSGVRLGPGQSVALSALVQGLGDTRVLWSLLDRVGRVTQEGLYTAPVPFDRQQTVRVSVQSLADPSKTATVTIYLVP